MIDRVRVHLDTDIGGDIDDLCALALLLNWPGVEITGVTTVLRRSGEVQYLLARFRHAPHARRVEIATRCGRPRCGPCPRDGGAVLRWRSGRSPGGSAGGTGSRRACRLGSAAHR